MYRQGFQESDSKPSTSSPPRGLESREPDFIREQPRTDTLQLDDLIKSASNSQLESFKRIVDYLNDSDPPWVSVKFSSTPTSPSEPPSRPGSMSEPDGVGSSQVGSGIPSRADLALRLLSAFPRQSEDTNEAVSGHSFPRRLEIVNPEVESISSHSEETERSCQDSRGFVLFEQVLCRLLKAYYQDAQKESPGQCAGDNQSRGPAARATQEQPSRPASSARGRVKKRHMTSNDNSEEDEDDNDQHNPKRAKQDPLDHAARPRFLACPFWKLDPVNYWECFTKKTRTIAHVKQHLNRKHAPDFYCPRCFAIFPDDGRCEVHLAHTLCVREPLARLDGISYTQRKKLSTKSSGPVEQQWFTIWTLLFPEVPRPSSVYVDSGQSEMLQALHEFNQRRGPQILREVLESRGLELRLRNPDDNVEDILRAGLDCMLHYFGLDRCSTPRGNAVESAAPMGHHEENGQHEDTLSHAPGGSLSDPGVGDGYNVTDTLDLLGLVDEPPVALSHLSQSANDPPVSRAGSSGTEGDAPQTGASQHATGSGLLEASPTNRLPDHPLFLDDWDSIGFDQYSVVDPGLLAAHLDGLMDKFVGAASDAAGSLPSRTTM